MLRSQPLWPASTEKPFVPWPLSSAMADTWTGNGLSFAIVVATSALPFGKRAEAGEPGVRVRLVALAAEAEPVPLPLTVQAPYAATPATSSPVTATAARREI